MRIAIVGSGIAGNVIAHHLHREHDITVFEAAAHVGGHTHTHEIVQGDERHQIDTGFIVFNDWTYPNFIALMNELGVESQPSAMSFSVRNENNGLEYNGTSINSLFAQRRNFLRPSFYAMIGAIMRFNREAPALLAADTSAPDIRLGDYLAAGKYSTQFVDNYLIPMGAAIWSTDPLHMLDFPARFFVRFFYQHGMLSVNQRPQWRVIRGGSARYVEKLTAPFRHQIRLNTPVAAIKRAATGVWLSTDSAAPVRFDQVFLACHSDQALQMLSDATTLERSVLGAIRYQQNEAVLHTDSSLLPRSRLAWAAWNYHVPRDDAFNPARPVALTYNMNILQNLHSDSTFCVTLNHSAAIDPKKVIKRIRYHHPLYTTASVAAQQRQGEVNGVNRTYFCGAYWRNGFHEDGVVSALEALKHFSQQQHSHAQRDLSRVA